MDFDERQLASISELLACGAGPGPDGVTPLPQTQQVYSVLAVVDSARFSEIPSKRSAYEKYCVLDMQLLDDTCMVTATHRQTMGTRFWGAVTRDSLRHRYIAGSVVLIVGVTITKDNFRHGRMTLKQSGYNCRSISYVLLDPPSGSADGSLGVFDSGNSIEPPLHLNPQRYPALCRRVQSLRHWAEHHGMHITRGIGGSDNSTAAAAAAAAHAGLCTTPHLVGSLTEACGLSANGSTNSLYDVCLSATVNVFTPLTKKRSGKQKDPARTLLVLWQFATHDNNVRKSLGAHAALRLHDVNNDVCRLDMRTAAVEALLESSISSAIPQWAQEAVDGGGSTRLQATELPLATVLSESQRSISTGVGRGAGDDETQAHEEDAGAKEVTINGARYTVSTVTIAILMQSIRVLASIKDAATVLLADETSQFQAWCSAFGDHDEWNRDSQGNTRGEGGSFVVSCTWEQLLQLVKNAKLSVPQIVRVKCSLFAAHFSGHPQQHDLHQQRQVQPSINNLVRVKRPANGKYYGGIVSTFSAVQQPSANSTVGDSTTSTNSSWEQPLSRSGEEISVSYSDAVFEIGPPIINTCSQTKKTTTELGTSHSSHQVARGVSSSKSSTTPAVTLVDIERPNEYAPCDFYSALLSAPSQYASQVMLSNTQMTQNANNVFPMSVPFTNGTGTQISQNTNRSISISGTGTSSVRAVVSDAVLTSRIFSHIPASLAAISLSKSTSTCADAVDEAGTPASPSKAQKLDRDTRRSNTMLEKGADNLNSAAKIDYADAVRRLASALQASCCQARGRTSLQVHADVLILPEQDENGVVLMGEQHRCLLKDLEFV